MHVVFNSHDHDNPYCNMLHDEDFIRDSDDEDDVPNDDNVEQTAR